MSGLSGLSGLTGLSGVAGGGFNPTTTFDTAYLIAAPAYCFTNAAGTTPCAEGDEILCWTATNGLKFIKASASGFTLQKVNGAWYVDADGSGYLRASTGALAMLSAFTLSAIILPDTPGTGQQMPVMWGDESNGERRSMWINNVANLSFNGYLADVLGSTVTADAWVEETITKTSGNLVSLVRNGTADFSGTPSLNDYASDAITIGANNVGGENYNGGFARIGLKSSVRSAAEKTAWDSHAAAVIASLGG